MCRHQKPSITQGAVSLFQSWQGLANSFTHLHTWPSFSHQDRHDARKLLWNIHFFLFHPNIGSLILISHFHSFLGNLNSLKKKSILNHDCLKHEVILKFSSLQSRGGGEDRQLSYAAFSNLHVNIYFYKLFQIKTLHPLRLSTFSGSLTHLP